MDGIRQEPNGDLIITEPALSGSLEVRMNGGEWAEHLAYVGILNEERRKLADLVVELFGRYMHHAENERGCYSLQEAANIVRIEKAMRELGIEVGEGE